MENELKKLTNEEYREMLRKMLEKVDDNKKLRRYCIIVHDNADVEYPC